MQMRVQQQPFISVGCHCARIFVRPQPFTGGVGDVGGLSKFLTRCARQSPSSGHKGASQLRQQAPARVAARRAIIVSASGQHVRLLVPGLELQFGEQLKAVGGDAELGAWYLASAPFLSWTDGHNWIHHTSLPIGEHKFKLVIVRDGGSVYWEEGADRFFEVAAGIEGLLEVTCQFGDTQNTQAQVLEEDAYAVEVQDAATGDATAEDSIAQSVAQPEADEPIEEAAAAEEDSSDVSAVLGGDEVAASSEEPQASSLLDEGPDQEESSAAETIDRSESESKPESEPDFEASSQVEEISMPDFAVAEANEAETSVHSSNGSNVAFKTFGGAKASVIDDGTVLVTFSDDEVEDAAVLAERLFPSSLPGAKKAD